jgi:glutamate formiminotransferase / 5-formyltetrahydrofolate cyclo-ligase
VLECVVNVSEGRDASVLAALAEAGSSELLDLHRDPHHHRSVLTLLGEEAPRRVAAVAVERIDLRRHDGVHPRFGAIDVVPFVALEGSTPARACVARERFCIWAAEALGLPCFRYGDGAPTLPDIRKRAFVDLAPAAGPSAPHPTAGAVAVGCRPPLVAYNLWLAEPDGDRAQEVATAVRSAEIRALGLLVGERAQVSMNLVAPDRVGPADAYDRVAALVPVAGAELVGLVPQSVLTAIPEERWMELDLGRDRTIETRLSR